MVFNRTWPKKTGYYWWIDLSYPIPKIGFIQGKKLYDGNHEYDKKYTMINSKVIGIRIGDKITEPSTVHMVINHQSID